MGNFFRIIPYLLRSFVPFPLNKLIPRPNIISTVYEEQRKELVIIGLPFCAYFFKNSSGGMKIFQQKTEHPRDG